MAADEVRENHPVLKRMSMDGVGFRASFVRDAGETGIP
jgi:hypothetical protein